MTDHFRPERKSFVNGAAEMSYSTTTPPSTKMYGKVRTTRQNIAAFLCIVPLQSVSKGLFTHTILIVPPLVQLKMSVSSWPLLLYFLTAREPIVV